MYKWFCCCFKRSTGEQSSFKRSDQKQSDKFAKKDDFEKNIEWKDTVPFVPPVERGLVIKVYDGDTITIAAKLPIPNSPMYRFSVRLNGIDCPEIKGKDEAEKQCAQIARQAMSNLVMNKVVTLKNIQTEKYGRILADVYVDNLHLNQYMLDHKLAVPYNGKTKAEFNYKTFG